MSDWQEREALRFMVKMVLVFAIIILLLELAACDENSITVYSPGTRVETTTRGIHGCVEVTVDNNKGPTLMLVPMPIPYTAITAEKP